MKLISHSSKLLTNCKNGPYWCDQSIIGGIQKHTEYWQNFRFSCYFIYIYIKCLPYWADCMNYRFYCFKWSTGWYWYETAQIASSRRIPISIWRTAYTVKKIGVDKCQYKEKRRKNICNTIYDKNTLTYYYSNHCLSHIVDDKETKVIVGFYMEHPVSLHMIANFENLQVQHYFLVGLEVEC